MPLNSLTSLYNKTVAILQKRGARFERVMFVYLPSRVQRRPVQPNANFCLRSVSAFIAQLGRV